MPTAMQLLREEEKSEEVGEKMTGREVEKGREQIVLLFTHLANFSLNGDCMGENMF